MSIDSYDSSSTLAVTPELDGDTSSLHTLTESLRQDLYRINAGHVALNDDYTWAVDAGHAKFELFVSFITQQTYGQVCFEPETGLVAELLSSSPGPVRILDVGSGVSASWATMMAEQHPNIEVIGVDLVPSDLSDLPPNLDIEIHDILEGLPYPDGYFALIHARMVLGSVFNSGLTELARCLRPGGVLIVEEFEPPSYGFFSHRTDKNDRHLALARARNKLHGENLTMMDKNATPSRDGEGMHHRQVTHTVEMVRECEGFDGVHETMFELDIGARDEEEAGPRASQRGTLVRELILQMWALDRTNSNWAIGAGAAEEFEALDRAVLSEENVGLFVKFKAVWARKRSGERVTG